MNVSAPKWNVPKSAGPGGVACIKTEATTDVFVACVERQQTDRSQLLKSLLCIIRHMMLSMKFKILKCAASSVVLMKYLLCVIQPPQLHVASDELTEVWRQFVYQRKNFCSSSLQYCRAVVSDEKSNHRGRLIFGPRPSGNYYDECSVNFHSPRGFFYVFFQSSDTS